MTVRAIYENGVVRPTEPVDLPDKAEVEVLLPPTSEDGAKLDAIYRVLEERFSSGHPDTAERHNEHHP